MLLGLPAFWLGNLNLALAALLIYCGFQFFQQTAKLPKAKIFPRVDLCLFILLNLFVQIFNLLLSGRLFCLAERFGLTCLT
jgi:hypothetical protein